MRFFTVPHRASEVLSYGTVNYKKSKPGKVFVPLLRGGTSDSY